MQQLTRQAVEHIAYLARIQLTDAELDKYARQLSSILDYVSMLQKLDTRDVPVTAEVSGLVNATRPDQVASCDREILERLLAAMPEREGGLLKTTGVFA